eukprot:gnl/MRDRNA2_/MRDRNA2_86192_c0_seq1.p1 gnl/MRDRNA2_/MRDRNA2_86192_c0~~gnl/MRDRNA2_/MRDRNA2_86192_c0_seq1.p1  ORF type:complete len:497 (-),score=93.92 gnl/MRDRNA2_/MRDRNA2_86192_c0_seq1:73-1563(-)
MWALEDVFTVANSIWLTFVVVPLVFIAIHQALKAEPIHQCPQGKKRADTEEHLQTKPILIRPGPSAEVAQSAELADMDEQMQMFMMDNDSALSNTPPPHVQTSGKRKKEKRKNPNSQQGKERKRFQGRLECRTTKPVESSKASCDASADQSQQDVLSSNSGAIEQNGHQGDLFKIRMNEWMKKEFYSKKNLNEIDNLEAQKAMSAVDKSFLTTSAPSAQPIIKIRCPATVPFAAAEVVITPEPASIHFEYHGVAVVQEAMSAQIGAQLAMFIDSELAFAYKEVQNNSHLYSKYFGSISTRENRRDLKLPLAKPVQAALRSLSRSLGSLFQSILADSASPMCELCCVISDPGAKCQPLHPDTTIEADASKRLVTIFIALQDVTKEMGPTVVCPGTHCATSHDLLKTLSSVNLRTNDQCIEAMGGVHACCSAGSAVIMDSRLVHCGGANLDAEKGGRRRRLLCISFAPVGDPPKGSTYSMRDEIKGKYNLDDFINCRI